MALTALETKMLDMLNSLLHYAAPGSPLAVLRAEAAQKRDSEDCTETLNQVMREELAVARARSGVHEVYSTLDGERLPGFLDSEDKPFCRIEWYEDSGDRSVGIPATACWVLAEDQAGTILGYRIAEEATKKTAGVQGTPKLHCACAEQHCQKREQGAEPSGLTCRLDASGVQASDGETFDGQPPSGAA